jgi:hypothetical protein
MRLARASLGQTTPPATCGSITNWLCSGGSIQSVLGVPCSSCPSQQAELTPTLAAGSTSPGLPEDYDATTGTVGSDNTAGMTATNAYAPVYPNNPGGGSDVYDSSGCDLSTQSLLSPSTWCTSMWVEVLGFAVLGTVIIVLMSSGGGKRRRR